MKTLLHKAHTTACLLCNWHFLKLFVGIIFQTANLSHPFDTFTFVEMIAARTE